MQDNTQTAGTTEEQQFKEFRRMKKLEEAQASILKIECDCLSPLIDKAGLKETCKQATALKIGSVVVFPTFVKACVSYLGKDPQVGLIASVAHPFGEETTEVKALAVKRAVKDGVDEVEVAAPVAFIKEGNFTYFKKECKKLKKAAKNCALRIVFDCALLTEKELMKAAVTAADSGVNCLRLNNCDSDMLAKVKAATKGKCLIKADGADNAVMFTDFCAKGADTVACKRAFDLANYLINQANAD